MQVADALISPVAPGGCGTMSPEHHAAGLLGRTRPGAAAPAVFLLLLLRSVERCKHLPALA
jgi:hypothetical protein